MYPLFTSPSQNASRACPEVECDKQTVSSADDASARTNTQCRPHTAPSACGGDSVADVFTQKHRSIHEAGFSLVELMVSLSIFSIVMTVSVGTLLILIDANAKAQALSSAMTNLTFAIDSMTRNLRTGSNYYCTSAASASLNGATLPNDSNTNDCQSNTAIVFTPGFATTTRMAYRINNNRIEQWIDKLNVSDTWIPITSDQPPAAVTVAALKFIVEGAGDTTANDYRQPRVTILITGSVQNGLASTTSFDVQSRITQRILNY